MFKRVERKRKRQEEEEELGLDEETKETMGLIDTDSDTEESDSGSVHESARFDNSDTDVGEKENATSEDEGINEDFPISIAEALKDPIYLISLDPTVHGCMLCTGKLIKNTGMADAHKNANAHKRRFEHFRVLSADADPCSNAWDLIRSIQNSAQNVRRLESQEPSKRALKRQARQAAMHEKRKRHKELKAKAIAKKTSKKSSTADKANHAVESKMKSHSSPALQRKTRKNQKVQSETSTSAVVGVAGDMTTKSASRTKASNESEKPVCKSRRKGIRRGNKPP